MSDYALKATRDILFFILAPTILAILMLNSDKVNASTYAAPTEVSVTWEYPLQKCVWASEVADVVTRMKANGMAKEEVLAHSSKAAVVSIVNEVYSRNVRPIDLFLRCSEAIK